MGAARVSLRGEGPHWGAFAALLLLLSVSLQSTPSAEGATGDDYDLTVLVFAADGPTQVALSYSRTVDHGELRDGLEDLLAHADGTPGELVIQDGPLERGSSRQATGAQFAAPGLVDARTGMLPVGSIVRSLPAWRHMRLVFVMPEGFQFAGPGSAVVDGFAVALVNRMKAYEYDVERKSGRVVPPEEAGSLRPRAVSLLPAVFIGLPTGFLLGWVFSDRRGRASAARRG